MNFGGFQFEIFNFFFSSQIYEDIIEGRLFQTIACHRPRSLTTFHVRDETLLAFIENESDIQVRKGGFDCIIS